MNTATAACVRYHIDTKASQFTVQAFANGLISAVAHSPKIAIRDWTGTLEFTPGSLHHAKVSVNLRTSSFAALDELREQDRRELHRVMNQEVLETARYPNITFSSTAIGITKQAESVFRANVEGDLSLHGITRRLSFGAQLASTPDTLRAYGDFIVLQPDYNIQIASVAYGTLKLREEVKLSFYVIARREE
jgi:polyisoprenoid-binding protein YceI